MVEVAQHSFSFPSPKRERKLSDEGQQEEAKRSKSPKREDVQLAEQHGSGGEGGEEEERERRERLPGEDLVQEECSGLVHFGLTDEHWAVHRHQQHFK